MSKGVTSVLGSWEKEFGEEENIFDLVFIWTWISSPITGSKFIGCPPFC